MKPLAKKVVVQKLKNNHYGIYEYLQVNLAYSSSRMASNRLTREQVLEIYRTGKISVAFEPNEISLINAWYDCCILTPKTLASIYI